MYDKEYHKAVKSAALQCGLTDEQAKAIMDTLWRQLRDNFASAKLDDPDSFENCRLINFGMFYSTQDKRDRFNKSVEISKNGRDNI